MSVKETEDDFFTDDLVTEKKKRKKRKADGKKKGNRDELQLVKVFNQRFGGGFSRSVGSGNRWGQVAHLPKHAQEVFLWRPDRAPGIQVGTGVERRLLRDRLELGLHWRQQGTRRVSGPGDEGRRALRAQADAVLEAGPEAVAGVRADEGTGRAFLQVPASLQGMVCGGTGGIVETFR